MARRPLLGVSLIVGGMLAVMLAVVWNLGNYQDEGPRCTVGCAQSALNWYWFVAETSASIVVIGGVAAILGAWFTFRKASKPSG
jgi:hypothetical protein